MRPWESGEGEHLGLGVVHERADLGNMPASWSRTWSLVELTESASGWAKIVRNTAATMSVCDRGTKASRLRAKCKSCGYPHDLHYVESRIMSASVARAAVGGGRSLAMSA